MNTHKNAPFMPRGRAHLVKHIASQGLKKAADKAERIKGLCSHQRLGYEQIAERVGVSKSTVGCICVRAPDWPKLPSVQDSVPVRCYEKARPGELLHLDMKKLGCFDRPGHRVTGDRTRNTSHAGWQALHVAIDGHSRVGFSQVLKDETSRSAATSCSRRCATTASWAWASRPS